MSEAQVGKKSYTVAWALSLVNLDRFYLGKIGTGIFKFLTFGGFTVLWAYDLIMLLIDKTTDKEGNALAGHGEHKLLTWLGTAVWAAFLIFIVSTGWSGK